MEGILKDIYNNIIPGSIRKKVSEKRTYQYLEKLRSEIINYLEKLPKQEVNQEQLDVLKYLKEKPLNAIPYNFLEKYNANDVTVFTDKDNDLKYVLSDGKKLFFRRDWSEDEIRANYSFLLAEQDADSPHLYLTENFRINKGDIVADIGVAEGNFALSIIEQVSKIYLFEADEAWIEALAATFTPWKHKVEIINKYVSDQTNDTEVKLDDIFSGQKIDFLKIDVEGAELKLLNGAASILQNSPQLKVAICTYHKQNDGNDFSRILKEYSFATEFSKGYIIFYHDIKGMRPPYLRKGLIRAHK